MLPEESSSIWLTHEISSNLTHEEKENMEQLDIYKCATSSNRDLKIQRRDGNENVT